MIEAVYNRKYNRLTVKGHAYSGEPGHDLVCSAASMLAYTLAVNVAGLSDKGQATEPMIKLEPGDTEIACRPRARSKSTVALVFNSVCVGFEILAHDYPENISYEVRG